MAERRLVVGLGNPGKEYAHTRHNVGFRVIDSLSCALKIKVRERKFGGYLGFGILDGGGGEEKKLILLKPISFVNRSGQVVATAVGYYKIEPRDLIIITDDMALETGRIRIRAKGSAGGHKGLDDIIEKLGTEQIPRLRIGIGKSRQQPDVDYVLDRPAEEQKPLLDEAVERAKEAVLCWIECGIETAQNRFND